MWRSAGAFPTSVPALAEQDEIAFASADHIPVPGRTNRVERVDARRSHRILSMFLGLPAQRVRSALHDLRFSNTDVRIMTALAERWLVLFGPMSEVLLRESPDDATIRRWAATTGRTQLGAFLRLAAARWAAMRAAALPAPGSGRVASSYRRAVRIAYRDPIELADLAVDGEDLLREAIARGPTLGKILRALLEWVVDDPARNTRDELMRRAAHLAREAERASGDAER
jgi:tRNA nucleotidyltransferase (CCA-adding enzyme)